MLRVGGALVGRHQVALALAAGCRRVICVARNFSSDLSELQHDAEQGGASFHLVSGALGLSGLVTAADEVLAIAEGLLPTPGDALPLIATGTSVVVVPAEPAVAEGFERIDLNHAWAGLMLVPGRLVDRLMDLPADVDPVSTLLRIALQAGVPLRPVPDSVRSEGHWLLIRTEADAQSAEEHWLQRHTRDGPATPGAWISRMLVRRFGGALLHEASSCLVGMGFAVLFMVLALAAGWVGYFVPALGLAALSRLALSTSTVLLHLRRDALGQARRSGGGAVWGDEALDIAFDLALIALLTLAMPVLPGQHLAQRAFEPLVLVGLLRLLPRGLQGTWPEWLADRFVLVLFLALLAAGRVLELGVPGISVVLLMAGLALPGKRSGSASVTITRA